MAWRDRVPRALLEGQREIAPTFDLPGTIFR